MIGLKLIYRGERVSIGRLLNTDYDRIETSSGIFRNSSSIFKLNTDYDRIETLTNAPAYTAYLKLNTDYDRIETTQSGYALICDC